ncbi:MAG: response regulator, partial [Bacteroidetes bacterium]|nr:response regulator [Bacteroidota bacterium]
FQTLAHYLWQINNQEKAKLENIGQAQDWLSQTKMELDSINNINPNATTDVGKTINEILNLVEALKSYYGVDVKLGYIHPNLTAAVQPTIFRQTLITAIGQLARIVLNGEINIYVIPEEGLVKITFDGSGSVDKNLNSRNIFKDIIVPTNASIETHQKGDHFFVLIRIPSVGTHIILVIEDNQDIVYFYRRCIVGNNYKIIHIIPSEDLYEKIDKLSPDIIVLDVMLPNVDGWQILSHLHERLATRSTPVIVCSVVKEEWLALALGGSIFLPKPVKRQQFLDALDQVMHQVSSKRE